MSVSRSVQFRRAADVIEAYENNNVPSFAITSGTGKAAQMLFIYETDDMNDGVQYLEGLLTKLQHSAAIYTLCLYNRIPEGGIVSNTPYRNSFNFQLKQLPNQSSFLPEFAQPGQMDNEYLSRLEALTVAVRELQAEKEEEPVAGQLGMIGALMEHPVLGPALTTIATSIGEKLAGLLTNNPKQTSMSGVPGVSNQAAGATASAGQEDRLHQALAVLRSIDPDLTENLYKLAVIAQRDPEQYKKFVGFLALL